MQSSVDSNKAFYSWLKQKNDSRKGGPGPSSEIEMLPRNFPLRWHDSKHLAKQAWPEKTPDLAVTDLKESKSAASTILIYADCVGKLFGDYSAGGELAYALQSYVTQPYRCVLVSTQEGLEKFKQLYLRDPKDTMLSIHNMQIGFTTLEDIILSKKSLEVSHFIHVARCGIAPIELVRQATHSKTKFLFLGLAHIPSLCIEEFLSEYDKEYIEGRVSCLYLGNGKDRIGFTLYCGPYQALDHIAYRGITTKPFGFAYFSGFGARSVVGDYMRIAHSLNYKTTNYVFIASSKLVNLGVMKFLEENRSLQVVVYGSTEKTLYRWLDRSITKRIIDEDEKIENNEDTIKVVRLNKVLHEQMRVLMQSSVPFIGVTGVSTMLEAFSLGKIGFIEYLSPNDFLIKSYVQFTQELLPPFPWQSSVNSLTNLLVHRATLSTSQVGEVVEKLGQLAVRERLQNGNFVFTQAGNATASICYALGLARNASADLKHQADRIPDVVLNSSQPVPTYHGKLVLRTAEQPQTQLQLVEAIQAWGAVGGAGNNQSSSSGARAIVSEKGGVLTITIS